MVSAQRFNETIGLSVEALALARGDRLLFEQLSFNSARGDCIEVRGPNGAGKISLLRAVAGFLRPHAGRIRFDGAAEPATALHFVGHLNGLKGAASVASHLRYWKGLLGAEDADCKQVLDRVELLRQADLPARALSQGQARRIALARLLIAPRPIWLLDEPAAGLDTTGKAMLTELVERHLRAGGQVITALHEPLGLAPTQTLTLA
jgi:heme exporter protein A